MARKKRNDFAAGMFIIVALAGLAAILIATHNWSSYGVEPRGYVVRFDQASGVKPGSSVMLGGYVVGSVQSVKTIWSRDEAKGGDVFAYNVGIEIPADIPLHQNARIVITGKLIGEGAEVNILDVGSGPLASRSEQEPIVGHSSTAMFNAAEALGIGDEQRLQIQETLTSIQEITGTLKTAAPKIAQMVDNIDALTVDIRKDLPTILKGVQNGVEKLQSAATQIDEILTENRGKLKTSIDAVAEISTSARTDATKILDDLKDTSGRIRVLVDANSMNISATLENLRQTSEQLEAASKEIRRAPWRLLYKPGEREADTLNVYDASRAYADAASDLQSTVETLHTLMALEEKGVPVDRKLLDETRNRLEASLKRYGEAESALWKQWGEAQGK